MIYLDNAATTLRKPPCVINAVHNALVNYSANPGRSGHKLSISAAEAVFNTRSKVAAFFGAQMEENVVFTINCTYALNCVIKGTLKDGDHVVVGDLEHNAVMRPLSKVCEEKNIEFSIAKVEENDDQTLENFRNAIKDNTKLIICTHASNVLGCVLPISDIGNLAKSKGILFCVDAAQSAGVIPIDMQKMNIDFLCIAAHKGLMAPMGTGILIAEKPLYNTIVEGGTGTHSMSLIQPEEMPERLESGTINLPGILGISAGIDFINSIGIKNIYSHEFYLIEELYSLIVPNYKIVIYTKKPKINKSVAVLSFNIKGEDSYNVAEYLNKKGVAVRAGFHCAPGVHKKCETVDTGMVRISLGYHNTQKEIYYLVNMLKKY